ncbi:MAG: ABC transporter substrate-binding protein [Acetatifactor sp.]|nr:ABC transporter substrate-binding protein [Acetatifactor sp.]
MKRFFCSCKAGLIPVLILCIAALTGCGEKEDQGEKLILNEVAHSVFYAPMYVAIEEGYFEEEGIDLELVTGFGADKTMTAVLTDSADIGFMGCESTIYTYAGGTQDYVVNFAQLTQRAGNFLVAREPVSEFSWDMLKGKTVLGGRNGGMPEMIFEFVLEKNNIDAEKDLIIDKSIDFGSTAAAFSGGKGDFTIEFEPHATALEQKGDGYVGASLGEESGYVPYTAFCAKKSFIDANPHRVQAFTDALKKGMEYMNEHSPEDIARVIAPQFPETDLSVLTMMIERYAAQDTWKTSLVFEKDSFELLQNILMDAGVLEERVPYEDLVTTTFAEKE